MFGTIFTVTGKEVLVSLCVANYFCNNLMIFVMSAHYICHIKFPITSTSYLSTYCQYIAFDSVHPNVARESTM